MATARGDPSLGEFRAEVQGWLMETIREIGENPAGNEVLVQTGDGEPQRFQSGKVMAYQLHEGDRYILRSGGGGGFGSPLDRNIEAVEADVRAGYVSGEAAGALYGVVVDPETSIADRDATANLRAQMQEQGLPVDEPVEPYDPSEEELRSAGQLGDAQPMLPNRCC